MPFNLAKSDKSKDQKETPKDAGEETKDGDVAVADPPATEGQAAETPRTPVFRPAFLDEETPSQSAAPAATETVTPPPEGDTFFVSVTRDGAAETHRFDNPTEVQTFVEQLLENDVPEADVTAFSGRVLTLTVRHRPVVKLVTGQE